MIAKPERHEQETALFAMRNSGELRTLLQWLHARRDEINAKWPGMSGDDLMRIQGEASLTARLIKVIEQGPSIKAEVKNV
jgi:hypothetical protein